MPVFLVVSIQLYFFFCFFFFQAEDGIRDWSVTGVQTCALPISPRAGGARDLAALGVARAQPRLLLPREERPAAGGERAGGRDRGEGRRRRHRRAPPASRGGRAEIGRASCREGGAERGLRAA